MVLVTSLAAAAAPNPSFYLWMWWAHMVTVLGFLAFPLVVRLVHAEPSPWAISLADLRGSTPS